MNTVSDSAVTSVEPLKAALIDQLRRMNAIRTAPVQRAFRTVDRHRFAPEAPLEEVYSDKSIVTKRDDRGLAVSSMSAPRIQAFKLPEGLVIDKKHTRFAVSWP
ncbi:MULTISPECIES: hypothetical protein [unclassified Kitasatospora]|uniref:hypothetical protein n=1 Tax=unclassified Kitasatospora TaxID=2633591 RepID=UPI0024756635|nr:hypothetical protein [Kitasatospora sp. MAP12-44]